MSAQVKPLSLNNRKHVETKLADKLVICDSQIISKFNTGHDVKTVSSMLQFII